MGMFDYLPKLHAANNIAVKQSAVFPDIYSNQTFSQPQPPQADTDNFLSLGTKMSYVYTAVKALTDNIVQPTPVFKRQRGREKAEDDDIISSLPDLEVFFKPNQNQTRIEFVKERFWHKLLTGESYIELVKDARGRIVQFYNLRPDRISIIPHPQLWISGFQHTVNGKKHNFDAEDVYYTRFYHPANDYHGLSPLEAAREDIILDLNAVSFSQDFFNNGLRVSGVYKIPLMNGEPMDRKNFNAIKNQLKEQYGGLGKQYQIMVTNGAEFQSITMPIRDVEFLNQRKWTKKEVGAVFGMPPILMQDYSDASILANADIQVKNLWMHTIMPILRADAENTNLFLLPRVTNDSRIYMTYDFSGIKALQEDEDALVKRIKLEIEAGIMTENEGRAIRGRSPEPGGNQLTRPINRIPFATVEPVKVYIANEIKRQLNPFNGEYRYLSDSKEIDIVALRDAQWADMAIKQATESRLVEPQIRKLFKKQAEAIQAVFEAKKDLQRELIEDIVKVLLDSLPEFENTMRIVIFQMITAAGNSLLSELGIEAVINLETGTVLDYLGTRLERYGSRLDSDINVHKTTLNQIKQQLKEGFRERESINQLAERVSGVMDTSQQYRARMIAQTESTGAVNRGTFEAAKVAGISKKMWLSSRDGAVRDSHLSMDGTTIDVNEDFSVNGDTMPHPSGGSSPDENINCRCFIVPSTG